MKPSKKKAAKRKYSDLQEMLIGKLLDLKYRINDVYRNGAPGLLPDKSDKDFVIGLIHNIRKLFGQERIYFISCVTRD